MKIKNIFEGDKRTSLVKKNIAGSLLIKGWSCIIQFLIVPLSLNCLSSYEYGIWLTINAILIGIDSIDVGLGNGLRNKLAEAMANNDPLTARKQVSTTFVMLIITIIPLIIILSAIIQYIDCYKLLNVDPYRVPNLNGILTASVSIMGATFIFKFIGNMYLGLQLPAINNLLVVLGQTVSLIALFIISIFGKSDLMTVSIIFTASPLIVYIAAYPITFCRKYKFLAPSYRFFSRSALKELLSLGISFFFIQITGLMLFMLSNTIISNVLNPAEVTPYQVAYRYFSILYMLFAIIAAPLWPATTDAYTQGDWPWINRMMKKLNRLLIICAITMLLMILFASTFYRIWVGDKVHVETWLSVFIGIYCYLLVVSNSYSYILFGIGKIRVITIVTFINVIVFAPLEYIACRHFGTAGLISILIVATSISAVINCIQFNMLSSNKAKGIWNK
jgi:O-antigen/teichoic acid export membrane protein